MIIQRQPEALVPVAILEDARTRCEDTHTASDFLREFLGDRPFPAVFDVQTEGESPWDELFGLLDAASAPLALARRGKSERVFLYADVPDMELLIFAPEGEVTTAHLLLTPEGDSMGNHARFELDSATGTWELVGSDLAITSGIQLKKGYLAEGTTAQVHVHYARA